MLDLFAAYDYRVCDAVIGPNYEFYTYISLFFGVTILIFTAIVWQKIRQPKLTWLLSVILLLIVYVIGIVLWSWHRDQSLCNGMVYEGSVRILLVDTLSTSGFAVLVGSVIAFTTIGFKNLLQKSKKKR